MLPLSVFKNALKYCTIRIGLEITSIPLLSHFFPSASGRGVIFTLHHVRPTKAADFDPNDILSITPEFLEVAICAAQERGLIPVHLHDIPALLSDPTDNRKFFAFTLDDGYKNNAEFAAPVFRKFNIPYTVFITPGFVSRTRTIWWETAARLTQEVTSFSFDFGTGIENVRCKTRTDKSTAFRRLADFVQSIDEDLAVQKIDDAAKSCQINPLAIVDELVMTELDIKSLASDPLAHIGAHTINHVNLRRISPRRLKREVENSISQVQKITGQRPLSFAYPYGWKTAVSQHQTTAVAAAGIRAAVTTQPGVLTLDGLKRPEELPRISLNGKYQKRRYVNSLMSGLPFILFNRK
ncbi:polysaccharide deacetylase family protein [Ochrobactrum sp. Marseille-Q0166]|uniref:polysaccharide deacetylase family protein n=1 Tax=Ochrobactrum sp. Marseille-Q0166 TaxID=2761105 RepID=UPI001655B27C|nr:polysaccharide deacetylase family protein [Ochrobactrum sp. Marseille-Q0166]MBC8718992.1 polysaccharide deacetylase family protein [Ochrobactrum sp. Marseille-Q0166]